MWDIPEGMRILGVREINLSSMQRNLLHRREAEVQRSRVGSKDFNLHIWKSTIF